MALGYIQNELLDAHDCILDSPSYRQKVVEAEDKASQFEQTSIRTIRACNDLLASSEDFSGKFDSAIKQLLELAWSGATDDPVVDRSLNQFQSLLQNIEKSRIILCTQLENLLIQPLKEMLQAEVSDIKKEKRDVESSQSAYEGSLGKLLAKKASDPGLVQRSELFKEEVHIPIAKVFYIFEFRNQTYALMQDFEPTMHELGTHLEDTKKSSQDYLEASKSVHNALYRENKEFSHGDDDGYEKLDQTDGPDSSRSPLPSSGEASKNSAGDIMHSIGAAINPLRSTFDRASRFISNASGSQNENIDHNPKNKPTVSEKALEIAFELPRIIVTKEPFSISGYLFLRSHNTIMTTYQRRWFEVSDTTLVHYSRNDKKDALEIPLHLCMVKDSPGNDRRNSFSLFAPSRTYILQAETELDAAEWLRWLTHAIQLALYAHNDQNVGLLTENSGISSPTSTMSPPPKRAGNNTPKTAPNIFTISGSGDIRSSTPPGTAGLSGNISIQSVLKQHFARYSFSCVDCDRPDPEWASITYGSLLCIQCSGIHRSLGVHVTKVRSLNLDKWEPELLQIMLRLGNHEVNKVYEAGLSEANDLKDSIKKPNPGSPRSETEAFIKAKYIEKSFLVSDDGSIPDQMLHEAACSANLPAALMALANGADPNYYDNETGTTPLMEAVALGDFGMSELIIMWKGQVNLKAKQPAENATEQPKSDTSCRISMGTCLGLAAYDGNAAMIWYLVRRLADWNIGNADGKLPLDIALEKGHIQAVTALRYAKHQNETGSLTNLNSNARDEDSCFTAEWSIPTYLPITGSDSSNSSPESKIYEYWNLLPPYVRGRLLKRNSEDDTNGDEEKHDSL
ncbi:hypothetical protein H4219_001692 [Mycoemilia scoparia]|uniref:Uncharacterized protein n=1 Tax=Mycoemilia scoparia TaxID=417184 RepID=A0A9W8A498_9FUNG|nr:hypothetical protein H4219_001692 [Mycoemilia scoparia]